MDELQEQYGYGSNPLRKYRNIQCPCGSKKKAKRCCGTKDRVSPEELKKICAHLATMKFYGPIE